MVVWGGVQTGLNHIQSELLLLMGLRPPGLAQPLFLLLQSETGELRGWLLAIG